MDIKIGSFVEMTELIDSACMIQEANDYAEALESYFFDKAERITKAVAGYEKEEAYCHKTYGLLSPNAFDILETLDCLRTVLNYITHKEARFEAAVEDEMKKPTIPQTQKDKDTPEYLIAMEEALFKRHSPLLHIWDIVKLRDKTPGLRDEEYRELFSHYGLF